MKLIERIKRKIIRKFAIAFYSELQTISSERNEEPLPYQIYRGFKSFGSNSFFWGNSHEVSGLDSFEVGENVHIGNNAFIHAIGGVKIGDNTHISRNFVLDSINHDYNCSTIPYDEKMIYNPVVIGKNVWIGMNVCIAPGTIIGDGCIIGMGTTVSGIIPPLSIVSSPKCIIIEERDKDHYNYLDELKRYGGANGQLYKKSQNNCLQELGDSFIANRSTSTLIELEGKKAVKKDFLQTEDGKSAFQTERNALFQFQHFNWCPKILHIGAHSITTQYFDNKLRLDQQVNYPRELLGEILWNLFELFEQGFAHRDIHAKNIFVTNNGIKFIDFETAKNINPNVDFWEYYDITGEGIDSPYLTSNMGIMNQASAFSLSKLFNITSIDELKLLLDKQFEKRMLDSSITFKTLRDGKERHALNNPKIYSTFNLLHTKISAVNGQRNTDKRFEKFRIENINIVGKRILDIGSNIGATLLNLDKFNPSAMIGLEYDRDKVEISKKLAKYNRIKNVQFQTFDIETDNFETGEFDVVFCLAVIEHLKNKEKLFDLLEKTCKRTLYFEGNANSDIEYITKNLKNIGFTNVEYLGLSDDEINISNNNRPLFIAKR